MKIFSFVIQESICERSFVHHTVSRELRFLIDRAERWEVRSRPRADLRMKLVAR